MGNTSEGYKKLAGIIDSSDPFQRIDRYLLIAMSKSDDIELDMWRNAHSSTPAREHTKLVYMYTMMGTDVSTHIANFHTALEMEKGHDV